MGLGLGIALGLGLGFGFDHLRREGVALLGPAHRESRLEAEADLGDGVRQLLLEELRVRVRRSLGLGLG